MFYSAGRSYLKHPYTFNYRYALPGRYGFRSFGLHRLQNATGGGLFVLFWAIDVKISTAGGPLLFFQARAQNVTDDVLIWFTS